jgi:hypothetical protein
MSATRHTGLPRPCACACGSSFQLHAQPTGSSRKGHDPVITPCAPSSCSWPRPQCHSIHSLHSNSST